MNRIACLTAMLLAAIPAANAAPSLRHTLQQFGLLGHWAADCSKPVSSDNIHGEYRMQPDGTAHLQYDFSPGTAPQIRTISSARVLDAHHIQIRLHDEDDNTEMTEILVKRKTRLQVFSATQSDGKVIVNGGIATFDNKPVVWLSRCRK